MKLYHIPQHISVLIFDIDGTLYQNHRYMQEQTSCQIRRFAETRNIPEIQAHTMIRDYQAQWRQAQNGRQISLADTLQHFGVPITDIIAWRKELLHPEKYLQRDPKLITVMQALSKEYMLVCVTNNAVAVGSKTLEVLGCGMYISTFIGLDTYNVSKPDQRIFAFAAKNAGISPDCCISIGDRYDIDIAVPLKLGMGGIVTECIDDVYRLPDLLVNRTEILASARLLQT